MSNESDMMMSSQKRKKKNSQMIAVLRCLFKRKKTFILPDSSSLISL